MLLLAAIAAFSGCYKDKGNYDYQKINDVFISTTRDTFQVLTNDTLKITPTIAVQDPTRLRYEWRVNPITDPANPLGPGTILVISRERDLKVQITLRPQTFPYQLVLAATDTITGVSYFKNVKLLVSTAFQTGWMLLEQKSGIADISFIGNNNKVYNNVYSTTNPGKPLPANSFKLISAATQSFLGTLNMVCFDNGGYVLDNTSLAFVTDYSKMFFTPPAVVQPKEVLKPSPFQYGPLTISGDKIYGMTSLYTSTLFGAPYTQPDAKGYGAAPFVAGGLAYGAIFFDQKNYRFLYDGGGSSTALKAFPATPTLAFDLSNVQKNMLTMKAGMGAAFWPTNWYALFKNTTDNNCFLYTLNTDGDLTNNPVASAQQAILNSPEVHRSPDYLFSNTVRQMYYAADNKLYVYDMAANQSRVIYTFAANENITTLQIQNNNTIVLATYSGTAGSGTVYYLPISSTGDISGNTYTQKFTSFNKIIHLVYKIG
jgi:hypothetical protein